jgi:hypothetical protein
MTGHRLRVVADFRRQHVISPFAVDLEIGACLALDLESEALQQAAAAQIFRTVSRLNRVETSSPLG